VIKSAGKITGFKPKKERNTWFDEECQRKTEDKNNAQLKMIQRTTRASVEEFKRKRRVATNTRKKKRRKWENERLVEIQNNFKEKNSTGSTTKK
jgi:hypothetical protein